MPMTQREMIKLLKKHGYEEVKSEGKGSHIKMKKRGLNQFRFPKVNLKRGRKDKY